MCCLVNAIGSKRLPGMKDVLEQVALHRTHEYMRMVGHHHVLAKNVSLTIKMPQGGLDDSGNFRLTEQTLAIARIEPLVEAIGEAVVIISLLLGCARFGILLKPF